MKFYAIPVDSSGNDIMDASKIFCSDSQSTQTFIRRNNRRFEHDKVYSVYEVRNKRWSMKGYHSVMPFHEHTLAVTNIKKARGEM